MRRVRERCGGYILKGWEGCEKQLGAQKLIRSCLTSPATLTSVNVVAEVTPRKLVTVSCTVWLPVGMSEMRLPGTVSRGEDSEPALEMAAARLLLVVLVPVRAV